MCNSLDFGYYPHPLDLEIETITISTLPDLDKLVEEVGDSNWVDDGWVYAPNKRYTDILKGPGEKPYSSRIFGLPTTHRILHEDARSLDHLRFIMWMLGFFLGMRLSDTEAGYLDATPIKRGVLNDFHPSTSSLKQLIKATDRFWLDHENDLRTTKAMIGIVHSLFLAQCKLALSYERFIYSYTALEGCHYVWTKINDLNPRTGGHSSRIENLCTQLGIPTPKWAKSKSNQIASTRNETLHEGLFFDEPLGFRIYGGESPAEAYPGCVLPEMEKLICRILIALLGFSESGYVHSKVDDRQVHSLDIS